MLSAVWHPILTLGLVWAYAVWIDTVGRLTGEAFRICPSAEPRASMPSNDAVVRVVLTNQLLQLGTFWGLLWAGAIDADIYDEAWLVICSRLLVAAVVLDTWQYWTHRLLHEHPWLFGAIHGVHHELEQPMSYGAFYQHVVEGVLMDAVGFAIAQSVAGLALGPSTAFATLASLKTAHDHCGHDLPVWLDPMSAWVWISDNTPRYHIQHHQRRGNGTNFQQPFFTFWDDLCGTRACT